MRTIFLVPIFSMFLSVACNASPDIQSSNLVGEWQGGRHAVQYKGDGTWRLDPLEGTTHGTWKIKNGVLTQTYWVDAPFIVRFSIFSISLPSKFTAPGKVPVAVLRFLQ